MTSRQFESPDGDRVYVESQEQMLCGPLQNLLLHVVC